MFLHVHEIETMSYEFGSIWMRSYVYDSSFITFLCVEMYYFYVNVVTGYCCLMSR